METFADHIAIRIREICDYYNLSLEEIETIKNKNTYRAKKEIAHVLRNEFGLTVSEIATIMKRSNGAVLKLLHKKPFVVRASLRNVPITASRVRGRKHTWK